MRNQFLKISAVAALTLTLFSCGSSRFSRSHYGNRSWGKVETVELDKATGTEINQSVQQNDAAVQVVSGSKAEQKQSAVVETASTETFSAPVASEKISATTNEITSQETGSDMISNEPVQNGSIASSENADAMSNSSDATNGGADTNTILLVILAILLPPLAVYLKDGSASTLFWITLILCLIGGGPFFGWYGGYFFGLWGIAMILALLRVLDII